MGLQLRLLAAASPAPCRQSSLTSVLQLQGMLVPVARGKPNVAMELLRGLQGLVQACQCSHGLQASKECTLPLEWGCCTYPPSRAPPPLLMLVAACVARASRQHELQASIVPCCRLVLQAVHVGLDLDRSEINLKGGRVMLCTNLTGS